MIFFIISLSTYFCYLVLKSFNTLELLQKEKFNVAKAFKWIKENAKKVFLTPEILAIILIIIIFSADAKIIGICMVIFYMFMFLYKLKGYKKQIKFDGNVIRTGIITLIIYILVCITFAWNYNSVSNDFIMVDNRWLYYIIMILMIYFNSFIILISGLMNNGIIYLVRKFNKLKKGSKKSKK